MSGDFRPTPHPVIKLPTRQQAELWGEEKTLEYLEKREKVIAAEKRDPYRYGYIPPHWDRMDKALAEVDEILLLGGNRSGKSEASARRVMRTLLEKDGARAWCFQTTGPNSVEMQQPILWKYIPEEYKSMKRGRVVNISYSQKGGFTQNTFVLPNGSQCIFRNYEQRLDAAEGGEVDIVWADELIPLDLCRTLRYRLSTRADTHELSGKFIVSFTPITGYNATVKEYLDGARTLEDAPAPLINPNYRVPLVQQCERPGARVIYFHGKDNPYGGWPSIERTLKNAPVSDILCRAYGVAVKMIGDRFPLYSEDVHVIDPNEVPDGGTNYMIIDPSSGRNWFAIWVKVIGSRWIIYREFPTENHYYPGIGEIGPWAEPDSRRVDGKPGAGSESFGWGLQQLADYFHELESDETVFERFIDSRFAGSPNLSVDRPTTLLEELASIGFDCQPTPGLDIDEGVELINNALSYDPASPVGPDNSPRLFISRDCTNVRFAMKTWTGKDGKTSATKDVIDVVRYFVTANPISAEKGQLSTVGGGSY